MVEARFELNPKFHESFIGHFDLMTRENRTRIDRNAGMSNFELTFKPDGTCESIKLAEGEFKIEDLKKDGRFYDRLREKMNSEERIKFDEQIKEAAGKKVYRTGEQIEASRKVTENSKNMNKLNEMAPNLESNIKSQSWFNDALKKLAVNVSKYGFLTGVTALGLYEIGQANKGCYLENVLTGVKIGDRLSASTDRSDCSCAKYSNNCKTFCDSQVNASQTSYDTNNCDLDCMCLQKATSSQPINYQPAKNNAQFRVVEGGVWQTFSNILGSVGKEVTDLVNDAITIADSVTKGFSNLFSKWWVILIIVGVGLVIILVPTLVTQLPKKARAKGITGG